MNNFEYNTVPWTKNVPSKPGLYFAIFNDKEYPDIILLNIYPNKGELLVDSFPIPTISTTLHKFSKLAKLWSPKIKWEDHE